MIEIDKRKLVIDGKVYSLDTTEGFLALSDVWVKASWDALYGYTFTWLGRPLFQLPEDVLRVQELIYRLQPDVIVEVGIGHGGGLVLYASLCAALQKGRVIGVELKIRDRKEIEEHPLARLIALIEGNSIDSKIVAHVQSLIKPGEKVLVFLDSCHKKKHVLAELEAYSPLVTTNSYIVVMDSIMGDLEGCVRTKPDWGWNNPKQAVLDFVETRDDFVIDEPPFLFNESKIKSRITYLPSAFLKRIR